MLECNGYKMFKGVMEIKKENSESRYEFGTWMFDPEKNSWICGDDSYEPEVCGRIIER